MRAPKAKSIRERVSKRKLDAQPPSDLTFGNSGENPAQSLRGAPTRAEFIAALPRLRLMAQQLTRHRKTADRLVEQTIERAIEELETCPRERPLEDWLIHLMGSTGIGQDLELLN